MNIRYLARETVELVLNEGSDLDFPDSGSEENIFDSGEEFVPVDLEADLRDSDNNIFIFIIGIRATSRLKLFFILYLDSSHFAVGTEKGIISYQGLFCFSFKQSYWYLNIP